MLRRSGVDARLYVFAVGGVGFQIEDNHARLMLLGQAQAGFGFVSFEDAQASPLQRAPEHFPLFGGRVDEQHARLIVGIVGRAGGSLAGHR